MRQPDLTMHYSRETMRPATESAADGHALVWLRMLNGEDDIAISDAMLSFDSDGRAHLNNTSSEVVKICRSVERIDGLEVAGQLISALDLEAFKRLPRWMVIKVRLAVNAKDLLAADAALPE